MTEETGKPAVTPIVIDPSNEIVGQKPEAPSASRRSFLTGAAAAAAGTAAAGLSMPNIARAQTVTMRLPKHVAIARHLSRIRPGLCQHRQRPVGRPSEARPAARRRRRRRVAASGRGHRGGARRRPRSRRLLVRQEQGLLPVRHPAVVWLERQPDARLDPLRRRSGAL